MAADALVEVKKGTRKGTFPVVIICEASNMIGSLNLQVPRSRLRENLSVNGRTPDMPDRSEMERYSDVDPGEK